MRAALPVLILVLPLLAACAKAAQESQTPPAPRQTLTIDKLGEPVQVTPKATGGKLAVLPPEPDGAAPVPGLPITHPIPKMSGPVVHALEPDDADPTLAADCREAERQADPFAESHACRRILGH